MQALNRPLSLALAGALLLCLTGCGQIRPSGTTDSAAPAAESDLLQFQVGRQSRTLAPGDHYDCRDGSTERLAHPDRGDPGPAGGKHHHFQRRHHRQHH